MVTAHAAALTGAMLLGCTPDAPATTSPAFPTAPTASAQSIASAAPSVSAGTSTSPPLRTGSEADASSLAQRPVADAAPSTPDARQCAGSLPPADMMRDNIAATAISGLAEIVASAKTALDGKSPAPSSGYVSFRYEVRVLEYFSGAGADRLVLTQGAEADLAPQKPGRLLFFSACASSTAGASYEPDVGYFFPVDAACRAEAQALGNAAAKRARSSGKRKLTACRDHKP